MKVKLSHHTVEEKKRVFLFVYAGGHGIAHHYQEMIINSTSGNRIPLERELREITNFGGTDCHVFAAFDMCKSIPELYPGLTYTEAKYGDRGEDTEHATRKVEDVGFPFHALSSSELQSTTAAKSDLTIRMIKHIEIKQKNGYLKVPNAWLGFDCVITSAKDAQPYRIMLAGRQFNQ